MSKITFTLVGGPSDGLEIIQDDDLCSWSVPITTESDETGTHWLYSGRKGLELFYQGVEK